MTKNKEKHSDSEKPKQAHEHHEEAAGSDHTAENEALKQQLRELTDTLQRLQAEFDNYRKRIDRQAEDIVKHASQDTVNSLLPVVDNFELALKAHKGDDDFHKGMNMIYSQVKDILESRGLKHIECVGKKFDPHLHETLISEESEQEPNIILEELQRGYMFHDKVLRHSKVKVSKKKQ